MKGFIFFKKAKVRQRRWKMLRRHKIPSLGKLKRLTMDLFTKERIMFRKPFRITIHFLIGFVIWTTCVHMHCNRLSQSQTGSVHCEVIFCSYCADWPMHGFSAHFQKCACKNHVPKLKRALRSHVLGIRLARRITIQNALFSRFKSLIWKSFAFTEGKFRLSNQEMGQNHDPKWPRNVILSFVNRPNIM